MLVLKNGRVCPTNYEQPQHHDYIHFPSLSIEGISSRAAEFYASGLSLAQISRQLNKSLKPPYNLIVRMPEIKKIPIELNDVVIPR